MGWIVEDCVAKEHDNIQMKLYKISQDDLRFLGFSPKQIKQNHYFNRNNLTSFTVCILCCALTLLFLICEAKVFVEYVEAIYIFSAGFGTIVTLTFLRVKSMSTYIKALEKIITTRKTSAHKTIYDKTNRKVENWSQIISFLGMKAAPTCGVLSLLVPSFFFYFTTDKGKDAFLLPVPMWFPFDWRNPFGYLIAVFIQYIFAIYGFSFFGAILSFGFGSFLFTVALVDDTKGMLREINNCAKLKANQTRVLNQLFEYINFHSDLKNAFQHFITFYKMIFVPLFSWSLITICGAMLIVQTEIISHYDEINSLVLIVMLMEVVCAYGWLLVSCELGQRFSAKFDEISYVTDQFRWYSFPMRVKRLLPTIIFIAQQPMALEVFGSIACLRDSFKSVVNTAFSYFMVLREFSG